MGHHWPACETLNILWQADGGPTLTAGFIALWFYRGSAPVLLRNPIFLSFFRRGPPPPPPLDPHMTTKVYGWAKVNRKTTSVMQLKQQYLQAFWKYQLSHQPLLEYFLSMKTFQHCFSQQMQPICNYIE